MFFRRSLLLLQEIKPFLTRNIKPLLNICVLLSIESGNSQMMKLFLDNGADPNGVDDDEVRHIAVQNQLIMVITSIFTSLHNRTYHLYYYRWN